MTNKNIHRRWMHLAAAALAGAAMFAAGAQAETARTIKIVVPLAPGGAGSVVARVLADEIAAAHHVTTVVENRPGGSMVIGTEAVSGAAPDGNTLLVIHPSILGNALLHKQNYHPLTSLEPVCKIADQPDVFAVNSESPYRSLNDFVTDAREKPGQLTVATFGVNIPLEDFRRKANVNITFVPYSGSSTAVPALMGGHITAMRDNLATLGEQAKAGKLRVLATFAPERIEGWPDVPTFAEAGYDTDASWWGLFAPAKTPKDTVSELAAWTVEAMQKPEVKQKLVPLGQFPTKLCGADFAALLQAQYKDFGRIVRENNLRTE